MNTKKIILESVFSTHQKIHLSIFGILFIAMTILSAMNLQNLRVLLLFLIGLSGSFIYVAVTFSKKGFLFKNNDLYYGIFYRNYLLKKRKLDIKENTAFAVLKFKKRQKYAFFTAANPDLASEFNAFDIYLLNEKHTQKEYLISLKNEDHSFKAVSFLEENTGLKFEIYSPDFS